MSWVEDSNGNAPANSLVAGHAHDGEPTYVARAEYEGNLIPGKLVSSQNGVLLSWGGQEISKAQYQVLINSTDNWVPVQGGDIPANALIGGKTSTDEILYVGRVYFMDTITPGRVQQNVCYITLYGQELEFSEYEVLLAN